MYNGKQNCVVILFITFGGTFDLPFSWQQRRHHFPCTFMYVSVTIRETLDLSLAVKDMLPVVRDRILFEHVVVGYRCAAGCYWRRSSPWTLGTRPWLCLADRPWSAVHSAAADMGSPRTYEYLTHDPVAVSLQIKGTRISRIVGIKVCTLNLNSKIRPPQRFSNSDFDT